MRKLRAISGLVFIILLVLSLSACITSNYSSNDTEEQKINLNESINSIIMNSGGKIIEVSPANERWSEVNVKVTKDFIGSVMLNANWNTNCYGECIADSIFSSGLLGSNAVVKVNYYDLEGKLVSVYSSDDGPVVYYKFE